MNLDSHFPALLADTLARIQASVGLPCRLIVGIPPDSAREDSEVSAIVGFTGPVAGAMAFRCSEPIATRLAGRMLRTDLAEFDQDAADAFGEIANIAAGSVCGLLDAEGEGRAFLAPPRVIVGIHRVIWKSHELPCRSANCEVSGIGLLQIQMAVDGRPASARRDPS